jgi:hypothetical protein
MDFDISAYWVALSEKERKAALGKAIHARLLEILRDNDFPLRESIRKRSEEIAAEKIRESFRATVYDRESMLDVIRSAVRVEAQKQVVTLVSAQLKGLSIRVGLSRDAEESPDAT